MSPVIQLVTARVRLMCGVCTVPSLYVPLPFTLPVLEALERNLNSVEAEMQIQIACVYVYKVGVFKT